MIPFLNEAGRLALPVASSMLLQTALLAITLLLVEALARHRLRASLRCGLWLLVIAKLLLPPSLKSPISPGYWLGRWIAPPLALPAASAPTTSPKVNPVVSVPVPLPMAEASPASTAGAVDRPAPEHPRLNTAGALVCLWILGAVVLAFGVLRRNQQVRRLTGSAHLASGDLSEALRSAATELGLRRLPELRLTQADHSPAVSGLFRPVIVLPAALASRLTPAALRDVLLHELIHVQRRDLWLNLPQALVQILWWWNPFVWLANARIRHLREQAVDEQVMLLTHGEEESTYPATLVAVARYCADRPVLTLSFVGILESRHHLRSRVERLLNGPLPHRAGLGRTGWLTLVLTACLALPMAFARRVDPARTQDIPTAGPELSSRLYRFDPDRLITALEERVSYTVEDFSVDHLPSNHGGDYPGGPGTSSYPVVDNLPISRGGDSGGAPGTFTSGASAKGRWIEPRVRGLLGKYFSAAGVTFVAPNPRTPASSQKAFSFDAASGTLAVRASGAELASIDKAIQSLSLPPAVVRSTGPVPILTSTLTIPASESSPSTTPDTLRWLPWSSDRVRTARQKGQIVLVDFTAKWCVTCRVNRHLVLEDPTIAKILKASQVLTLEADWTQANAAVTEALAALGRPGVPAVVVYSGDADSPPIVLPEQLTREALLVALELPDSPRIPSDSPAANRLPEILHLEILQDPPFFSLNGRMLREVDLLTQFRTALSGTSNLVLGVHALAYHPAIVQAINTAQLAGITRFSMNIAEWEKQHESAIESDDRETPQGSNPATQIQTNVVDYVSRPAKENESPPKFYAMDPLLARRYGLIPPASTPTNSPLPAASSKTEAGRSIYAMDPLLARRYGLIPKDPQRTNDSQITTGTGTNSTPERHRIAHLLHQLTLEEVSFDNLTLTEVLDQLQTMLKEADPQRRGINLLEVPAASNLQIIHDDSNPPTTIDQFRIRIMPGLKNIRVVDALNAIVESSDHPIVYTIEDYAVVFKPKVDTTHQLLTRQFHLPVTEFVDHMKRYMSEDVGGTTQSLQTAVHRFLTANGVDFSQSGGTSPNPTSESKSFFFNDRNGRLFVRATAGELDQLERAIQHLSMVPGSQDELLTRTFPLTIAFPTRKEDRSTVLDATRNSERSQGFVAGLLASAGVTIPARDPAASAEKSDAPRWFLYDEIKGLLTVRSTEKDLSAVQNAVQELSPGIADVRIGVEIRIFEVAPSAKLSLSTGSTQTDRDPSLKGLAIPELGSFQILSGLEMQRLIQSTNDPKSSRSHMFGSAAGPASRRVGLGFDGEVSIGLTEVQVSEPESTNPLRVMVIPNTQPGIAGIDLDVLVRRTPDDSSPIRQRAHVMSGESLVLVRTPLPSDNNAWTQYVIVTPTLQDSATATDRK